MRLDFNKDPLNEDSGNGSGAPVTDSERLLKSAQAYFSSNFTNPSRINCPSEEALETIVRSGKLPEGELHAHLFGCSECFRSYQSLRAVYRSATPVNNPSLLDKIVAGLRLRPVPIVAGLVIGICVITGLLMWRSYMREETSGVVENVPLPVASPISTPAEGLAQGTTAPAPDPEILAAEQKKRELEPKVEKHSKRPAREMIAAVTVKIDLEKYSLLRGDETSSESLISLSKTRNRLVVTLQANSPKGLYKVSIHDAYGHELMSKNASSANGETLSTVLDMRALPATKYHLCISLPEEAPDCYPFMVVRK